jgi:hypothetical protein
MNFSDLNQYGDYDDNNKLPAGIARIGTDGTIRRIKRLGIEYKKIIAVEKVGRHHYPRIVGYAIHEADVNKLDTAIQKRKTLSPHPDLLLCIREASRAAHRERDRAATSYLTRRHRMAGNAKKRKEEWYALKDRGIVAAHKQGRLRYVGKTQQQLAVYEYGDGGLSCFHCTLHPAGVEQSLTIGHPENIFVESKAKGKGISLKRVRVTLEGLDDVPEDYIRASAPRIERTTARVITCWTCGEAGHRAFECDADDLWDFDEEFAA